MPSNLLGMPGQEHFLKAFNLVIMMKHVEMCRGIYI